MNPLLAREPELDSLHTALARAVAGRAEVLLVTGEAGSGKSALLAEFTARVRAEHQEVAVAVGLCDAQTGAADPYLPFREILAELTGARSREAHLESSEAGEATQFARWVVASGRALVEHAPDLVDIMVPGGAILTKLGTRAVQRLPWARRLAEITSGRTLSAGGAAPQLDSAHVFEQYTQMIRGIAREHPLVLVLDDLHWVDPASAGLLFHLARRLEEDRVLLIGAYRADDVALGRAEGRHPLEPVVNELQRYRGDLFVRLGERPESGRSFVDALLAAEAPGLDATFADELHRHTSGHPLFTLELLRHLQESGGLVSDGAGGWQRGTAIEWSALPARVEGVIGERAARLDDRQRELLATASVEGQEFSAEVLARVLEGEPRTIVRELSGDLEKRHRLVVARGVERVHGTRLAGYEFRHSLFHAWFYGTLDPVERVYVHESVGRALEALHADGVERIAARLARHFVEAARPAEAIHYLLLAGDRARDAGAVAEAAERYRLAGTLLERAHDELDAELPMEYAARIDEAFGVLAELAGEHDQATQHFESALRILESASPAAHPLLRGRIARRSAKPLENQLRHAESAERLDLAERLLGPPPADAREENEEWLQIQLSRLWVAYWRAQPDVMQRVLAAAAPVIERWGRPTDFAVFHYCRALMGMRLERYHLSDDTLAASVAAHDASRRGGLLAGVAMSEFGLGFSHLWRLELDDARRFLEQGAESARRIGDRVLESRAVLYRSVAARFAGDIDDALRWADRAEQVARQANLEEYIATVHAQRGWAALRRGELEPARRELETALESWARLPYLYSPRFLAQLPLMALAVQEERFSDAAAAAAAMLPPPLVQLREPVWSALQRAGDGDDPAAQRRAIELAEQAGYL